MVLFRPLGHSLIAQICYTVLNWLSSCVDRWKLQGTQCGKPEFKLYLLHLFLGQIQSKPQLSKIIKMVVASNIS